MVCDQLATINVVRPLAWQQHGCMYECSYFLHSVGAVGFIPSSVAALPQDPIR
jgi:hypothetical protein